MRFRRTHYALAVVVVATALAADRNAAVMPEAVKPVTTPSLARSLAAKLTSSFRRSVPAIAIRPVRRNERVAAPLLVIARSDKGVQSNFDPFQFRLPPPQA